VWDTAETVGVLPVRPTEPPLLPCSIEQLNAVMRDGRKQLDQAVESMTAADVPFALIGGKAVAAWIISADGVNDLGLRPIDLLIHERDADRALAALDIFGYAHRKYRTQILLRNSDKSWDRGAIRLAYAGAQVRPEDLRPLPTPEQSCLVEGYRCLELPTLVEMLLAQFRIIDKAHVRSLAENDLVNADWLDRIDPTMAKRLKAILEDPHG